MANADYEAGQRRARSLEKNTQPQGRTGSATPKLTVGGGNPIRGGGINRVTKGSGRR